MDIREQFYLSPYSCYLNLTSRCNLRCRHCFGSYSTPIPNELTFNEWKKVIDDLLSCKVFFVNISGGEPTQSPFFREFIQYLTHKQLHFILTTNAVFSPQMRDFLLHHHEYMTGIKVSLDGPDAESHGFLRLDSTEGFNPAVFQTTVDNIFAFRDAGIPLTVATVLHKENIKKMDAFQELIKKINPVSWFISPIIPVGRADANRFISQFYEYFDNGFWEAMVQKGREKRIHVRLIDMPVDMEKQGVSAYSCAAALNFCEIHADGIVSPCTLCRVCIPPEEMAFENIREKSLQEIWDGPVFTRFRSYMDTGCKGCTMLPRCNKCIAQSFRYFKNGSSPTPFCVKNGRALGISNLESLINQLKEAFPSL